MNAPRNTQYRHLRPTRSPARSAPRSRASICREDLPDDVLAEIRAALLDNLRDLLPRPEAHARAATRASRAAGARSTCIRSCRAWPDYPEILEIIKTPEDKKNFGGSWHTDQMFSPQPAMGTILYALEVPSAGGDTMFTNQYLAYESLSDGMKALVGQLQARSASATTSSSTAASRAQQRYERHDDAHEGEGPRQRADHQSCIRWSARIRRPAARRCISAATCSISTA